MDELIPRRDPRKFWDDKEMGSKVDSPSMMDEVTGFGGISKTDKLRSEYFTKNKFIEKFVGADRNKNKIPDILEKPFKKKGGLI